MTQLLTFTRVITFYRVYSQLSFNEKNAALLTGNFTFKVLELHSVEGERAPSSKFKPGS